MPCLTPTACGKGSFRAKGGCQTGEWGENERQSEKFELSKPPAQKQETRLGNKPLLEVLGLATLSFTFPNHARLSEMVRAATMFIYVEIFFYIQCDNCYEILSLHSWSVENDDSVIFLPASFKNRSVLLIGQP